MESYCQYEIKRGLISLVVGPPKSGKKDRMEQMIRRARNIKNCKIHKLRSNDTDNLTIINNDGKKIIFDKTISGLEEIFEFSESRLAEFKDFFHLVIIDELNLLNKNSNIEEIKLTCFKINSLLQKNIQIVMFGWKNDILGNIFPVVSECFNIANSVYQLHAVCELCGEIFADSVIRNPEKIKSVENILDKKIQEYIPCCKKCFLENIKKQNFTIMNQEEYSILF